MPADSEDMGGTPEQWDRLLTDLEARSQGPVRRHLTAEEFVEYTLELLDSADVARLDTHLDTCPVCAAEMERMLTGEEAWQGAAGAQRLAALRERLLAPPSPPPWEPLLKRLADELAKYDWQRPQPRGMAWAASESLTGGPASAEGVTPSGLLHWLRYRDRSGQLSLLITSEALVLDGTRWRVQVGEWSREVVLQRMSEKEIGAEVLLPPAAAELPFQIALADVTPTLDESAGAGE